MSKWGQNKLGKTGDTFKVIKKTGSSSQSKDRRDFLLNLGILLAAISFLTAFLGMSIGSVRIAYKFYQYIYIYVILLAALKYGMSGGLCASLALGVLLISASHVLPQFKTIQAIPLSPNLQLVFFIGIAYVAAYFSKMNIQDSEEIDKEIVALAKEIDKKDREIEKLKGKLEIAQNLKTVAPRSRASEQSQNIDPEADQISDEPPVREKPRVIKMRSLLSKKNDIPSK